MRLETALSYVLALKNHRAEFEKLLTFAKKCVSSTDPEYIRIGTELRESALAHIALVELYIRKIRAEVDPLHWELQDFGRVSRYTRALRAPQILRTSAESRIMERRLFAEVSAADFLYVKLDLNWYPVEILSGMGQLALQSNSDAVDCASHNEPRLPFAPHAHDRKGERPSNAEYIIYMRRILREVLHNVETGNIPGYEVDQPIGKAKRETAREFIALKKVLHEVRVQFPHVDNSKDLVRLMIPVLDDRSKGPERPIHLEFLQRYNCTDWQSAWEGKHREAILVWIQRALEQSLPEAEPTVC